MVQLTKENLIYIGASGTIAVAALALIGSSIFSGATTESLEITSSSLKKASGDAVLNVQVRNSGTSEIEHLTVTINGVELEIPRSDINISLTPPGILIDFLGHNGRTNTGALSMTYNQSTIIAPPLPITSPVFNSIEDLTILTHDSGFNDIISAGQTISYSTTIPYTSHVKVGESFVIVAEGVIDGSVITTTSIVYVTKF